MTAQFQKTGQKTLREENAAQKLNVPFNPPGGWTERGKCCGTVDKNKSKWTFLPLKSTSSSSSREDMIRPQLMPKYMPKDTLNANDCGLFYKHFLIKCTH